MDQNKLDLLLDMLGIVTIILVLWYLFIYLGGS